MPSVKKHGLLRLLLVQQIFIVITPTSYGNNSCPRPGVGTCFCKWTGPFCRVSCKGLNIMPEHLPVNTTYLTITDGAIKEIPDDYLLRLKNLRTLDLQHNKISKKFHLPKKIGSLDLRNNMLNSSSLYGMFDGLTKLAYIDLSFNPINDSFIPGTFSSLKNLKELVIQYCHLTDIKEGTFSGLSQLQKLAIQNNDLRVLRKGSLKGITSQDVELNLMFIDNQIEDISSLASSGIKTVTDLIFNGNRLKALPDLQGLSKNTKRLMFIDNQIEDISSLASSGIKTVTDFSLQGNSISIIPKNIFQNISIRQNLDLSRNKIKTLPPRFLENSPGMTVLVLNNNHIETVYPDSFFGLRNLRELYLFNNRIKNLPDTVFANLDLQNLFLNGNKFEKLKGRPFKKMKKSKTAIYLFANDIYYIGDNFLNDLGNETTLALRCQKLKNLPHIQRSSLTQINCAPSYLGWIRELDLSVSSSLSSSGFFCNETVRYSWNCIPCQTGSFGAGRKTSEPCTKCSAGGFYQDEMGQTKCKECNIGTYVHPNNAPGTTPLSCQACPQGTQSNKMAGYRACKCLRNFYRLNRFGKCFPCPSNAFTCENDYASLSKGFYWKWKNDTSEQQYKSFIANLMIENRDFAKGAWKYNGSLPSPVKCPRDSCLGGLNSSCQNGYHGPLCALCQSQYYNKMNRCIRCPSRFWAGFQIAIVAILFIVVLLALLWGDRKRIENGRTMADRILSCFKIVIGFYQVMAGVYSAFSNISWPSSVIWMQKTLHFIQLNVLQIAPLSCVNSQLSFNVLQRFTIIVALNVIVVALFVTYLVIRVAILKRKKSWSQSKIDEAVHKTKSSCIRNICVFLFATYPKTSKSIIQILSNNCVQLCFDKEYSHCDSYLRSDLSVQCHTAVHYIYSRIATGFLFYPVGFPVAILILVWKYVHKPSKRPTKELVNEDVDMPGMVDENRADAIVFTPLPTESPFKSGLRLFSENYKSSCWYWEALEMIRKLVLISGLTLIGDHSRTQIGLGAIISAVFAILYVCKRPIANKFENFLQTVALMAIFLNLGIGVMLKTSDNKMSPTVNKRNIDVGVSVMLIIINVAVIGIVTAAVLKVTFMQILSCCKSTADRKCSCSQCCRSCLRCCLSLLFSCQMGSGNFTHDDGSRNAILYRARNV